MKLSRSVLLEHFFAYIGEFRDNFRDDFMNDVMDNFINNFRDDFRDNFSYNFWDNFKYNFRDNFRCLWSKMPMFQRARLREGGLPLAPAF